jgi:hypothetical protein
MVCAELYAQWNNIVIGASDVAWRGTRLSSMHFGRLVATEHFVTK